MFSVSSDMHPGVELLDYTIPRGSDSKKISTCDAGDLDLIPGLGRSPGRGHGNPFQYSFLESPMDRGAWQAIVHGDAELDMSEQLSRLPKKRAIVGFSGGSVVKNLSAAQDGKETQVRSLGW